MGRLNPKNEIEIGLKAIFDCAYYIKNQNNKDLYNILESNENREKALILLRKNGSLKKEDLFLSIDEIKEQIPMVSSCREPPILDSLQKIRIILTVLESKNIDIGFGYDDIEKFFGAIVVLNSIYRNKNLHFGSALNLDISHDSPFITFEELSQISLLGKKVLLKLFEVFSAPFDSIDKNNVHKLCKYNGSYICIFEESLAYSSFFYFEEYVLNNTGINPDEYYELRGRGFEQYVTCYISECFPKERIHTNATYIDKEKRKHEIDVLVECANYRMVFECKTTNFLFRKSPNGEEAFKRLAHSSFRKGMKTLNDFYEFIKSENPTIRFNKNTQFALKHKPTLSLIVTLGKTLTISGEVSKIYKEDHLEVISPIMHVADLCDILFLVRNCENFYDYFSKRFSLVNTYRMFTADIDEIDAFGMITTPGYYERVIQYAKAFPDIDLSFMTQNGQYRGKVNFEFNNRYLSYIIHKYFPSIEPK